MNTTIVKKWAPALLSAAVVLFGGLQVLVSTGHGVVELLQFGTLLVTTVTTTVLPLIDARWQGALKTGLEVVGVLIVAVLPFAIDHTLSWANALLIAVAVMKALAAEFGVALRTSNLIDARSDTPDTAPVITTLAAVHPADVLSATSFQPVEVVGGDEPEQSGVVDEPKHLATS